MYVCMYSFAYMIPFDKNKHWPFTKEWLQKLYIVVFPINLYFISNVWFSKCKYVTYECIKMGNSHFICIVVLKSLQLLWCQCWFIRMSIYQRIQTMLSGDAAVWLKESLKAIKSSACLLHTHARTHTHKHTHTHTHMQSKERESACLCLSTSNYRY
jgi:hypothetical protein